MTKSRGASGTAPSKTTQTELDDLRDTLSHLDLAAVRDYAATLRAYLKVCEAVVTAKRAAQKAKHQTQQQDQQKQQLIAQFLRMELGELRKYIAGQKPHGAVAIRILQQRVMTPKRAALAKKPGKVSRAVARVTTHRATAPCDGQEPTRDEWRLHGG